MYVMVVEEVVAVEVVPELVEVAVGAGGGRLMVGRHWYGRSTRGGADVDPWPIKYSRARRSSDGFIWPAVNQLDVTDGNVRNKHAVRMWITPTPASQTANQAADLPA